MTEDKKTFFELLDPKSALIVGMVGAVLSLGTIGFFVLGYFTLKGKVGFSPKNIEAVAQVNNNQLQTPQQENQPAANIPKIDKPKVELFVMSYCPYGLQMEKAYVPVMNLLKNKADMSVKFVSYIMHGKPEIDENTRQYCIQKEEPAKMAAYLKCFYAGKNGSAPDYKDCLSAASVNQSKNSNCVTQADKQFSISAKYDDQTSWLSGKYPIYNVHGTENTKYGVQGSPTLVINGVQAEAARTPEAVKAVICNAFKNPPSECGQQLANTPSQPGFGL